MRASPYLINLSVAGAVGLSGCAVPSQDELFEPVSSIVENDANQVVVWREDEAESRASRAAIEALADKELSADEAVTIALLYNPQLQSRFEELGIARAQLIRATLLPNPMLDFELSFVEAGKGEIIELTVAQSVIDALLIPIRRQVAEARIEQVQMELVGDVLDLAAETRMTYRELQAQRQLEELFRQATDATWLAVDMATRLREAGNVPELDVSRERALHEEMKQRLAQAQARSAQLRGDLALLMGLIGPPAEAWNVPGRLPDPVPLETPADGVERAAIAASVDLQAEHARVLALGRQAGVEEIEAVFPEIAAGATAEREPDGTWSVGPVVAVPIPVFNWGQAASAESRARLRQAYHRYTSLAQRIRHTARARYTASESAAARARHLRNTVVPLRSTVTRQTQEQFNAMQLGVFALLDAKQREIASAEQYVRTLRDHWIARTEMEAILMGRLPRGEYGLGVAPAGTAMPAGGEGGGH